MGAKEVVGQLKSLKAKLSVMESLTSGLVQAQLGAVAGASAVFPGGLVTYANESKAAFGVPKAVIAQHGVISADCALAMAQAVRKIFHTEYGLSLTGLAGPGAMEGKPVGLVYIGIASSEKTWVYSCHFSGTRNEIRKQSATQAWKYMQQILQEKVEEEN